MALRAGNQDELDQLRTQVARLGNRILQPTAEELTDAITFLKIAKQFLDEGYEETLENAIVPIAPYWLKRSKPGLWQCYTGIALFGGVVNLASLEAMMHYAYLIVFASGRDFIWEDDLLEMIDEF